MLQIFNMHNVVNHFSAELMTHKNCIDYFKFDNYLRNRDNRFIDLKKGISKNNGEVLTIDDATIGAYNAAMLCATNKNYVTIFINPYYIENGRHYFMHYLSYFIEKIKTSKFKYNESTFDLSKYKGLKHFRKAIKEDLRKIPNETDRIKHLEAVFNEKINEINLPYHLRTMSKNQLLTIHKNKFVRVEYHGWTHSCLSSLSCIQIDEELEKSKIWFNNNLDSHIEYFAIPFGTRKEEIENKLCVEKILLEDNSLPNEFHVNNAINRTPLRIE